MSVRKKEDVNSGLKIWVIKFMSLFVIIARVQKDESCKLEDLEILK